MDQSKRFLEVAPEMEKAIVESEIMLIKYWLEMSPEEHTRQLEGRIRRAIWKLSPSLKSYSRWYHFSRASDDHVQGNQHPWAQCDRALVSRGIAFGIRGDIGWVLRFG